MMTPARKGRSLTIQIVVIGVVVAVAIVIGLALQKLPSESLIAERLSTTDGILARIGHFLRRKSDTHVDDDLHLAVVGPPDYRASAYLEMAVYYFARRRDEKGLSNLVAAQKLKGLSADETAQIDLTWGIFDAARGNYGDAQKYFSTALVLAPHSIAASFCRSVADSHLDERNFALNDANAAISALPAWYAQARRQIQKFFSDLPDRRQRLMLASLERNYHRTSARLLAVRGEAYLQNGNYERAIADYTKAIGDDPDNPKLFAARARANLWSGRLAPALTDFSHSLSLRRTYKEARRRLSLDCDS